MREDKGPEGIGPVFLRYLGIRWGTDKGVPGPYKYRYMMSDDCAGSPQSRRCPIWEGRID